MGWKTTKLNSEGDVLDVLVELQGRGWLTRGQSKPLNELVPSIDRNAGKTLVRADKLSRERGGIEHFRSTARAFSSPEEGNALVDDFVALMVLRHHCVPTRLLDWSRSPYVATYFAVADNDPSDGEIWSFSHADYAAQGKKQWHKWPQTTTDGTGNPDKFSAGLTAFSLANPPPWVIAAFYPVGFPRQNAQRGAYTLTARFGVDHADALQTLLGNKTKHHRYLLGAKIKPNLRAILREKFGIWGGSLFPDTAGAAKIVADAFWPKVPLASNPAMKRTGSARRLSR